MSPVGALHSKTAPAAGNDECSVPPFDGAALAVPAASPIVPSAVMPAMTVRLRSERMCLPFPLLTNRRWAPEVGGWRRPAPPPRCSAPGGQRRERHNCQRIHRKRPSSGRLLHANRTFPRYGELPGGEGVGGLSTR